MSLGKKSGLSLDRLKKFGKNNGSNLRPQTIINFPPGAREIKIDKVGKRYFDFIPYAIQVDNHPEVAKGDVWFERTYLVHWNTGPENVSVLCPNTFGDRCTICKRRTPLYEDYEANEKKIKKLNPQKLQLFNVIEVNSEDASGDIEIFNISCGKFWNKLEEKIKIEGNEDLWGFSMPDAGFTLEIAFIEDSYQGHPFLRTGEIQFVEREKQYDPSIIEQAYDLDSLLVQKTTEQVEEMFTGGASSNVVEEPDPELEEEPKKPPVRVRNDKLKEEEPEEESKSSVIIKKKAPEKEQETKSKKSLINTVKEEQEEEQQIPHLGKECPSGHVFGKDGDSYEECEECDLWEECMKAKAALVQ